MTRSTGIANVPDNGSLSGDDVASSLANLVSKALPFPPAQAILNGGNNTTPPGVLGQLFGAIALPKLDVQITIDWVVRRPNGTTLGEGRDFLAPNGINSPTVNLLIPPLFRELRADTIANPLGGSEVVCLFARVRLGLGTRSLAFELGGIPLLLLPLLVPTIVAVFTEPNFDVTHDSGVMVMVPEHSALTSAQTLFEYLRKLQDTIDALRGVASIATWLLGLDALLSSIPDQPRIRFIVAPAFQSNGVGDLTQVTLKRRPWCDFLSDDPNMNDRASSLIIWGLPQTQVEFYNAISYQVPVEGFYVLEIDPPGTLIPTGYVIIRSLRTPVGNPPVTFPPDNRIIDWLTDNQDSDSMWEDKLTSLRFSTTWIRQVEQDSKQPPRVPILRCRPIVTPPIVEGGELSNG